MKVSGERTEQTGRPGRRAEDWVRHLLGMEGRRVRLGVVNHGERKLSTGMTGWKVHVTLSGYLKLARIVTKMCALEWRSRTAESPRQSSVLSRWDGSRHREKHTHGLPGRWSKWDLMVAWVRTPSASHSWRMMIHWGDHCVGSGKMENGKKFKMEKSRPF